MGDFGLVRLGGSGTHTRTLIKTTTVFGTSAYMAPEAFRGDISVKMDTFSFGIVSNIQELSWQLLCIQNELLMLMNFSTLNHPIVNV